MGNGLKHNLSRGATWWRALYMVLFAIFYSVAEVVLAVVVIFQFLTVLIRGRRNERLQTFGQSLSSYIYQVLRFLTFNSERHPYPFSDWPVGQPVPEEEPQPAEPETRQTPEPSASTASAEVSEPEQPFEPAWAPEPPESAEKPSNPESPEKTDEAEKPEKTEESAKPEKPDEKAPG
ncbi:DUF4389 domain-containing protein [Marinobacterium arenosum]|uniref:DUF4389 domain-containing protein n=1 Tax=Marinobacterium arenosum TaxID=2862496 RepID=UPI001C948F89|nr:DUF4389 domain-containing protein [Marinobacterium arenosum]MBY4676986.1 DUF4389 domain-containing protein [Marinobacterium arenosum]